VDPAFDVVASLVLASALTLVLGAYVIASVAADGMLVAPRVEREADLPIVGRAPMHAVYRALVPLGRAIAAVGISANAVSIAALVIAAIAAVAFSVGHFGIAALVATIASLADGLDGLVARLTSSRSRFGQVLDSMIDRYVDALFLGGLAVFVREDVSLLVITLVAIVGSFMVSYASAVERELGVELEAGKPGPMRRSHRLAYLILGAALAPLAGLIAGGPGAELVPVFLAVAAIGVVGNVSAIRRLLSAARVASTRDDAPASDPELETEARVPASGVRR
jgi:CDP-diacylglycerol--glycerol-3-phosphate 3-phosphatidyltransferase